jgi:hypothetical protein
MDSMSAIPLSMSMQKSAVESASPIAELLQSMETERKPSLGISVDGSII